MDSARPLIRIAKRDDISTPAVWIIRISAFFFAILLGAFIFTFLGTNPLTAYSELLKTSLGRAAGIRQVVKVAVPLLGTAIALAPCFKMRYWNIGAEGQITMGAMAASYFALYWYDKFPRFILLFVMAAAAVAFGALWSMIPAVFKSRWNTNETLFTLMMNYIAIGIVGWLQGGPWEGKPGSQIIPMFNEKAVLPRIAGVHCGWAVILILTVVMFVYLRYTKHGYEVAVLGESINTARYAGMNVAGITVRTAAISGGICGLVGYMAASGVNMTLYSSVAGGVGFTAITVAWLAQLNPFGMVIISFLLAVLSRGASSLQTKLSIPASISDMITGIILFCMLGCEFFINYRLIFGRKSGREAT